MDNSPQQPNYFRFSDPEQEADRPQARYWNANTGKRIGIAVTSGIVLIFLGVFTVNTIKNIMQNGPKSELDAARDEIAQRQADCSDDDQACKAQAQTMVARTAGVAAACEGLEEKEFENCVILVAQEERESKACAELVGDAQIICQDSVLLARASDGEGMAICEGIVNETQKTSCRALVSGTARASGDCAKYGVEDGVCDEQTMLHNLLITGNYAGCAELAQTQREECQDLFASTDADGDGLSAKEEAEIGTSDANPDTDGDGYSDGVEVAAGYNPLN